MDLLIRSSHQGNKHTVYTLYRWIPSFPSGSYHTDPEHDGFLLIPLRVKATPDSGTGGTPESGLEDDFGHIQFDIETSLDSATGESAESGVEGEPSRSTGLPKRGPFVEGRTSDSPPTKVVLIQNNRARERNYPPRRNLPRRRRIL